MHPQANQPGKSPATDPSAPAIARLWKETQRHEQIVRIRALHLQSCDREARPIWERACQLHARLPEGSRIDLPSPRIFARMLGLYRSGAVLKYRPMLELQLSVKDIADALGYAKSTVEAALRWLGTDPIIYRGKQVAHGLGYIARTRRKAKAFVKGVLKNVYRTSETALTLVAKGLLGLTQPGKVLSTRRCDFKPQPKPSARQPRAKQQPSPSQPPAAPHARRWKRGLQTAQDVLALLDLPTQSASPQLTGGRVLIEPTSG